jgi:hypothetical protein
VITGAVIVGIFTIAIALLALNSLSETFGKDLDFVEED